MRFAVFIAVMCFAVAPAQAAQCDARKYGMDSCPNDVAHFLTKLEDCKLKSAKHCDALPCEYADLLHKYKGKEMPIRLIQDNLQSISGENAGTYAHQCQQ